jgi:hypothetical protein
MTAPRPKHVDLLPQTTFSASGVGRCAGRHPTRSPGAAADIVKGRGGQAPAPDTVAKSFDRARKALQAADAIEVEAGIVTPRIDRAIEVEDAEDAAGEFEDD